MRPSEIGEFGLIERIRLASARASGRVPLGIGDDAAVVTQRPGRQILFACDAMVEAVHFDPRYVPAESLGYKALAVNLSDIAAMGGEPLCALSAVGLTDRWSVEDVEALYRGMARCGDRYGCPVAGGDTVRSPAAAFVSVSVLGECAAGSEIRRSGARPGDLLCVTGELGGAAVGFEALSRGADPGRFPVSTARFLEPEPRLSEARRLRGALRPTAMIDISDGLGSEIRHLCGRSGTGCILFEDRVPVSAEAALWAGLSGRDALEFALASGEEYELLFTAGPRSLEAGPPEGVTVIGEMRPAAEKCTRVSATGVRRPLAASGWEHYAGGSKTHG
jgi:thiamine-monophosphate kinase